MVKASATDQPIMSTKISITLVFLMLVLQNSDAQFEDYCIADGQIPDDILLAAMNWACDNGADCRPIRDQNHACFLPNTPKDHASYAFNSYYQNMKHKGGSCYFTSAAILSADNPSHGSCMFESTGGYKEEVLEALAPTDMEEALTDLEEVMETSVLTNLIF